MHAHLHTCTRVPQSRVFLKMWLHYVTEKYDVLFYVQQLLLLDAYDWLAETSLSRPTVSWLHLSCPTVQVTVINTFFFSFPSLVFWEWAEKPLCLPAVEGAIRKIPAVPLVRKAQVRITRYLMCVLVFKACYTPLYLAGYPFSLFRVRH